MKVALVYDRVNKWGGAERVLLVLHEMFPDAPLYTSVYDSKKTAWAKVFSKIHTSFLQKIPFASNNHELLPVLMPLAFESFNFEGYDLVISVTSEAAKGIITKPGTIHICYCLTPTRYLWSGYDEYFNNKLLRFTMRPLIKYLRWWDRKAAKRPDKLIAISTVVQKRIKVYYNLDSDIIFPPVTTSLLNSNEAKKNKDYYLVVSRLVKYKKVDLVVEAFNRLGFPLVVVGTGREEKRLKKMALHNIKFVGHVSEKKLDGYYKNAKALILPQEEDFGIVSVEAQSLGVPVIAYKKGGMLDTVIPNKTGIFFGKQTPRELAKAVKTYDVSFPNNFKTKDLIKNSERFSKQIFQTNIMEIVKKVIE